MAKKNYTSKNNLTCIEIMGGNMGNNKRITENKKLQSRIHLLHLTPAEINNIILHSKSKKSTGFDNIDSYTVKQIAPQIVNQLANIFNKSFLTGIAPSRPKLKMAKVKDPAVFSN